MKIHVIIPHYGDDSMLEKCLYGVRSNKCEYEIVEHVINNNPPNENLLFTRTINKGLEFVGKNDVAWLLNNDCIPNQNCVKAAIKCLSEEPKAGIIGSKNLALNDTDFIYWGGSYECWPSGKHKTGRVSLGDLNKRTEERWITFSSAFISGELISKIGMLDENMLHICSDADYCFRAEWAGYKCFYEPESVVLHAIGTSNNGASEWLKNIMKKDSIMFRTKWIEGAYVAMSDPKLYEKIK